MTREEKIALCRKLKGEGLSVSQIAYRTGIARSTVGDHLVGDEHRHAVEMARNDPCPQCGRPRLGSRPVEKCRDCRREAAEAKAQKFETLWREGKLLREIADEFGWTLQGARVALDQYRAAGYDIPYRQNLADPKFPHLVAA